MHVHLIDASGFFHRAFYALEAMQRSDGLAVNAVLGFAHMLWRLRREASGSHIGVIFDGGRSGRDLIDPNYKANRQPRPEPLIQQLPYMQPCAAAFGLPGIRLPGFEADDIIATYAAQAAAAGWRCTIHSGDKDLMALLVHAGVDIYDPLKKQVVDDAVCVAKFGVGPHLVPDLLALMGDAVDNVPGVPKVGLKTAASLLHDHGSLEAVLAAAHDPYADIGKAVRRNLVDHADNARLSMRLVRLREDLDVPPLDDLARPDLDYRRLLDWLGSMEFNALRHEIEQQYGVAA